MSNAVPFDIWLHSVRTIATAKYEFTPAKAIKYFTMESFGRYYDQGCDPEDAIRNDLAKSTP